MINETEYTNNRFNLFLRLVIIPMLLALTSCATLAQAIKKENAIDLTPNNISALEGNYALKSVSELPYYNSKRLDGLLLDIDYDRFKDADPKSYIKITVVNENRLKITLMQNNIPIKEKILKGSVEDNYFNCNLDLTFDTSFWLIINHVNAFRMRFTKLKSGELSLDYGVMNHAFLICWPIMGADFYDSSILFKSVEIPEQQISCKILIPQE